MDQEGNVSLTCNLCKKEFSGEAPARQHYLSEAHRKKLDQAKNSVFQSTNKPFWCDPCNLQCNSPEQFAQHITSPRHNETVKRALSMSQQVAPSQYAPTPTYIPDAVKMPSQMPQLLPITETRKEYDFNGERGFCYLCNIDLTSHSHAQQHLSGSKHQKKKKQSDEGSGELLSCRICKVPFSCPKNAQEHLASAKHQKKKLELEQLERMSSGVSVSSQPMIQTYNKSPLPPQEFQAAPLADVPVYSDKHMVSVSKPLSLTSSITLLGSNSDLGPVIGASKQQNRDTTVPYTFEGKQGYCNICNVDLTSPQNAKQHLEGSKHLKAEKLWKGGPTNDIQNKCDLCNVVFSGPESAKQHFDSERHKKRTELPFTNFKVMEPEKPGLAQKVNISNLTSTMGSLQNDLPLNIQPDSLQTMQGLQNPMSESERRFDLKQLGMELPSLSPVINQPIRDLCLSITGGSLPTPVESYNYSDLYSRHNPGPGQHPGIPSISPGQGQHPGIASISPGQGQHPGIASISPGQGQHPGIASISPGQGQHPGIGSINPAQGLNVQNMMQEPSPVLTDSKPGDEEEYRFDGSRGRCNVCNIELTSRQHANQHLSGSKHAKAKSRWKSSSPFGNTQVDPTSSPPNPAPVMLSSTKQPFRFDGNRGWCNVCNIELTSVQHARQHLAGKNHMKDLARWESENSDSQPENDNRESPASDEPYEFNGSRGYCNVCKIALTSRAHAEQHLSGKPHEKALFRWQSPNGASPPRDEGQGSTEGSEEPAYVFTGSRGHCFVCNIELTSREHANQHLAGKNHARAAERKKMAKQTGLLPLECKVCLKSFSGQESAVQHYASAKHQSKAMMSSGGFGDGDGIRSPNVAQMSPSNAYMCEVCRCPLNTFEQLSIHKQSPNHLKTVEKMNRLVAVNLAADESFNVNGNAETNLGEDIVGGQVILETNRDHQTFVKGSQADQHMDLWNALRTGEITTVTNVVANAEPGTGIISKNGNSANSSFDLVVTDPIQGSKFAQSQQVTQKTLTSGLSDSSDSYHTASLGFQSQTGTGSGFSPGGSSQGASGGSPSGGSESGTGRAGGSSYGISVEPVITTTSLPLVAGTAKGRAHGMPFADYDDEDNDDDFGPGLNRTSGLSVKPVAKYNPLKNRNRQNTGNKYTIESLEDLDSDEEGQEYRMMSDLPDDDDTISFKSSATDILHQGAHVSLPSITTDNNPSLHSPNSGNLLSSISEEGSSGFPSSNAGLLSELQPIGHIPRKPPTNPYAGHFKYYCEICKRPMNTKKDYEAHMESVSHKQRAAAVEAPERDLGQIVRRLGIDSAEEHAYQVTTTCPRSYQVELFCKTMEDDRVIFLPTGTGKTLVSVMALSCMLMLNPTRPVLFLVDKVLLVLQQSKYIIKELGEKLYRRLPLNGSYPTLAERKLKIATLCGNLLPADNTPLHQHDVVVATAAYVENLVMKKYIHWTDFSLVVFDEAHHCVKRHPFNRLLEKYHRPCSPEKRPKILGLTASPAGRDSIENTYIMLKELFTNLGGARVAIVQQESELEDLAKYQSNAKLEIKYTPYSEEERDFRQKLLHYLCYCYMKLRDISNLESECGWDVRMILKGQITDFIARLDGPAINKFLSVLNNLKPASNEVYVTSNLKFLSTHSKIILLALSDMDGCGIPTAVATLNAIKSSANNFEHARLLGIPTEALEEAIQRSSHAAQVQQEFEDNPEHVSLYSQLLQTLNDTKYINWSSSDDPMSLILVRERAHAHRLSNFLKQSKFVAEHSLKVTAVVGHGSGPSDGGMKVKQQKRVLDGVGRKKYHIIVATSVAEEGVDIPECELVVCMNPPGTLTGLIQMRGRARKKGSNFIILCKDQEEEDKMKTLLLREHYMMEAAKRCIREEQEEESCLN